MKLLIISLLIMPISFSALAAKSKDYQYKVETQSRQKKQKNKNPYPYDSVEKGAAKKKFKEYGFWTLGPKVGFSGGFHGDKEFIKNDKTNRWFFNTSLYFRHRPWHRFAINALILQNNSAFVGGEWQFTPSRKPTRNYYGFGISHLLVSEKKFSNIVETKAYHVTASAGREFLLKSKNAWFVEARAYLGSDNYALQISAGYIIPF